VWGLKKITDEDYHQNKPKAFTGFTHLFTDSGVQIYFSITVQIVFGIRFAIAMAKSK